MQHDQQIAQELENWLRRARSDLGLARITLPRDVVYNDLCFHAQQAVEKSIKAVLIAYGIEFPRVHDIAYLAGLLPSGIALPTEIQDAASLTSYAVAMRYPGEYENITEEIYREALGIAEAVFAWAAEIIRVFHH